MKNIVTIFVVNLIVILLASCSSKSFVILENDSSLQDYSRKTLALLPVNYGLLLGDPDSSMLHYAEKSLVTECRKQFVFSNVYRVTGIKENDLILKHFELKQNSLNFDIPSPEIMRLNKFDYALCISDFMVTPEGTGFHEPTNMYINDVEGEGIFRTALPGNEIIRLKLYADFLIWDYKNDSPVSYGSIEKIVYNEEINSLNFRNLMNVFLVELQKAVPQDMVNN